MVARRVFTCLSNKELSNVQESVVIFFFKARMYQERAEEGADGGLERLHAESRQRREA